MSSCLLLLFPVVTINNDWNYYCSIVLVLQTVWVPGSVVEPIFTPPCWSMSQCLQFLLPPHLPSATHTHTCIHAHTHTHTHTIRQQLQIKDKSNKKDIQQQLRQIFSNMRESVGWEAHTREVFCTAVRQTMPYCPAQWHIAAHTTDTFHSSPEPFKNGTSSDWRLQQLILLTPLSGGPAEETPVFVGLFCLFQRIHLLFPPLVP